jgi:hypothetical protein
MKIYQLSKLLLLVLVSLLLMIPVAAQEIVGNLDELEIGGIAGHIHFDEDGDVYIIGYFLDEDGIVYTDKFFLAPAGVISPSLLEEGQYVEVTGVYLNDDTFKLTGIITEGLCDPAGDVVCVEDPPVEEPDCDATPPEECPVVEDPPVEGPDCDATPPEECPVVEEVCTPDGHPVAARIADAFDVSACEVEAQHDDGNGFGNIAKAYLLAEAYNQALLDAALANGVELDPALLLDAQAYLTMHAEGMGWGQIVKASGVSPSDLAPGKLKKRAANDDTEGDTEDTETAETSNNGNGNANANANANANNGNANANANSNNGNSNGNANANANSNNGNSNKDKDKKEKKGKKNK